MTKVSIFKQLVHCPPHTKCLGRKFCSAPGHHNCINGKLDSFGLDFGRNKSRRKTGSNYIWTKWLCLKDSDRDNKTNGDELGDPCCIWNVGDIPRYTTNSIQSFYLVSHPGSHQSVTKRSSCYLEGEPIVYIKLKN